MYEQAVGIDVSKPTFTWATRTAAAELGNDRKGFAALLAVSGEDPVWCMEATGRYHLALAKFGHEHGVRVLVVNPGKAKKYRDFVSDHGKTDRADAFALQRLARKEGDELRTFKPVPALVEKARDVAARRRALVGARVSLSQVADEVGDPGGVLAQSVEALASAVAKLDAELACCLKGYPGYERLQTIPGVGPLSAAALLCTLERGEFVTSDSLVAFAGLAPRANESGSMRGKKRLTHHGDAELRRMMFLAAQAATRTSTWKPYYLSQLDKGLPTTAAIVVLARKLLRVAWKVYRQEKPFTPEGPAGVDKKP